MMRRGVSRIVLGLMSGTSYDGIDAALVLFGPRPELLHYSHLSFNSTLRKKIRSSFNGTTQEICALNYELGEAFAKAALKCIKEAGIEAEKISAVASHGQTVCHMPRSGGGKGATLQIGEPAVIAQRTGIPVISDFRAADVAAWGEGAPLVPFADYVLFRGRKIKAVQNIGGISNVTVVTPKVDDVIAFDTGPGNCMIDEAMEKFFGKPYDRNGDTAKKGKLDKRLLKRLLSHSFFKKKPPKSTGRETFNISLITEKNIRPVDLVATLAHFTALSIKDAYERFIFPVVEIDEIILTGGGSKNAYLVGLLKGLFSPVKVGLMEDYSIPSGAKEALSFAILANETLSGRPSNLPHVTGAKRKVVLGKITLP